MQLGEDDDRYATYPMVETSDKRADENTWHHMARSLFSSKFKHMLMANKKDDLYADFLTTMNTSPQPKMRPLLRSSSSLVVDDVNTDPPARTSVEFYRRYKKPFFSAINTMVQASTVAVQDNIKKHQVIQGKIYEGRKTGRRYGACHSHIESRKSPPPSKNVPTMKYEKQRDEVHYLSTLSHSLLHNIVLRLMAPKFGMNDAINFHSRSKSGELYECGGKAKKLKNAEELSNVQLAKILHNRYCQKTHTDHPPLWFLDRNPVSLKDSLDCLKTVISKHAVSKEKVVYNYYSSLVQAQNQGKPQEKEAAVPKDIGRNIFGGIAGTFRKNGQNRRYGKLTQHFSSEQSRSVVHDF